MIKFDESFNWLAVLKDLASGMKITEVQHLRLVKLAIHWPTCACGQLCKNLPRGISGAPCDLLLRLEGVNFMEEIKAANWRGAIAVFHAIEGRTAFLLNGEPRKD